MAAAPSLPKRAWRIHVSSLDELEHLTNLRMLRPVKSFLRSTIGILTEVAFCMEVRVKDIRGL
jgi:hypothetical protein